MAEPDETAVLKRAKVLAERDGFTWELDFGMPGAPRWVGMFGREQYVFELMLCYLPAGVAMMMSFAMGRSASRRYIATAEA